jgi:regulator of sigma E protease
MGDFLGSIWWLLVALGVLVTFHEFGHFWVARRCGVRVLRFSVGFGKPLWRRLGKDGTEYVVAAIPLGGYVKMLDEREGPVPSDQIEQSFNRKSLGQRTAIVAAGPIFNLALALVAFWLMFMVGVFEIRALVGEASGLAEEAGLQPLDEIVAVNDAPTRTLTHVSIALLGHALDREAVDLTLEGPGGNRRSTRLDLDRLPDDFNEEALLEAVGIQIYRPAAIISELTEEYPAEAAGFRSGDQIVSVNDLVVNIDGGLPYLIQEQAALDPLIRFGVLRDGASFVLEAKPVAEGKGDSRRFVLGVRLQDPEALRLFTIFQHGPLDSAVAAFGESYRITEATIGLIGRMLNGSASLRNLSGPISIAQFARDSARLGLSRFLFFLGVLSLSLAILNFLPIPLLDGGHLMYYFVEWIKGSPVSDRIQIIGQYVGLMALAALMSLTFYNDILRLMS